MRLETSRNSPIGVCGIVTNIAVVARCENSGNLTHAKQLDYHRVIAPVSFGRVAKARKARHNACGLAVVADRVNLVDKAHTFGVVGRFYHERLVRSVQQGVDLIGLAGLARRKRLWRDSLSTLRAGGEDAGGRPPFGKTTALVLLRLVGLQPRKTFVYDSYVVVELHSSFLFDA